MCDRSDCTAKYFLAKGCSAEMVGLFNPITVDQQCYVSCMTKVTINILIRLKLKKNMQRVAWSWTVWQTFHSYILQQPYHKQHKRTLTAVWLHRAAYETREYGSTKGMRGNVATPKIWLRQTGSNPPSLLLRTWWTCNTTIKGTFPNKKCWEIWDNSSLKFQLQNWVKS